MVSNYFKSTFTYPVYNFHFNSHTFLKRKLLKPEIISSYFFVFTDRPKAPYLLIDSRRLDAGNIFVPVKENSELNLACVSEGGNPRPTLTWEVLLSPGVDRHAQKISAEVLDLEELKSEKVRFEFFID